MSQGRQSADRAALRIAALVLAAGSSRRMRGRNKLLEPVSGSPMLGWVLDALRAAGVDPVIVVTGHQRAAVEALAASRGAATVHNPDHALGMGTSLARGAGSLAGDVGAVLVCLGDMPFVSATDIARLAEAWDRSDPGRICVPVFEGARGHPVLFGREHFAALAGLAGDAGARALLDAHPGRIREVPASGDGVLRDIDAPEALACARIGGRPET